MPFNFLLWNCLAVGRTSVAEKGMTASIRPNPGESILAFEIDCEEFRTRFGVQRVCDALFFYRGEETGPFLLLVELKGTDVNAAVGQLGQTLTTIRRALRSHAAEYRAVVVTRGRVSPRAVKGLQKSFVKNYKAPLTVNVGRACDLRKVL